MSKILGLDVGTKKIGLAIGDTEANMVFPRPALLVDEWTEAWPALERLVNDEKIATIVIGWPLNDDGSTGPQAKIVDDFINRLHSIVPTLIVKQDERFTSQAVQREHAGRHLARGQEDSLAAQLLVETYLQQHEQR